MPAVHKATHLTKSLRASPEDTHERPTTTLSLHCRYHRYHQGPGPSETNCCWGILVVKAPPVKTPKEGFCRALLHKLGKAQPGHAHACVLTYTTHSMPAASCYVQVPKVMLGLRQRDGTEGRVPKAHQKEVQGCNLNHTPRQQNLLHGNKPPRQTKSRLAAAQHQAGDDRAQTKPPGAACRG